MTNFAIDADNISTTAAQARAAGAASLVVASSAGMPSPTGSEFFRLTILRGTPAAIVTILKVTGVAGDTLTVAGALDGYADAAVQAGDAAILACTAGTLDDIQGAVNALESDFAGLGTAATHAASDFLSPTGSGAGLTGIAAGQVGGLAPSATTDATNASNITSGTLPSARLAPFGASGASHSQGAVPDPGATAGTARFLREDAAWVTPTASLATGAAIVGATANGVLRADPNGNLIADANLAFDPSINQLVISNTSVNQVAIALGPLGIYPNYGGNARFYAGTGMTFICKAEALSNSTLQLVDVYGTTGLEIQHQNGSSGSGTGLAGTATIQQTGAATYTGFSWTVAESSFGAGGTHSSWIGPGSGSYALDRYVRPTSGGATPTVAIGAGAGAGATAAAVGNDVAGIVTVNTGTGTAAGPLFTLTYAHARATAATAPIVVPANAAAAACSFYVDATANAAASFAVGCASAPAASGTLKFYYRVEG